ncbi:MAG: AAA family ATPase, partial [Dehalococcoidia bacterium]|nr:AAA family ATPase [Dehalococcoidia bacterium]
MQAVECFTTSLAHLLAELRRIELKLHLEVMRMRQQAGPAENDRFQGLYISEQEIGSITGGSSLLHRTRSMEPAAPDMAALTDALNQLQAEIDRKKQESLRRGVVLRLHELSQQFRLSEFDVDTLLVCILPELDLRYQRLYAYLQDDVTKKSPTVDLVLRLLAESPEAGLATRDAFSPEATLTRYHLIRLHDEPAQRTTPLLARSIQADERMIDYLLGTDRIDARLLPFCRLVDPQLRLHDIILPAETSSHLYELITRFRHDALICHVYGAYGVGKQATAEAACCELGRSMLVVDVERMIAADSSFGGLVRIIFREAHLQNAAIYFDRFDLLLGEERAIKPEYASIVAQLESHPEWVFLAGKNEWQPRGILHNRSFIDIELPLPSYRERIQLWEAECDGKTALSGDVSLTDLAGKFRLSGGEIQDVIATARSLAQWHDPEHGLVTTQDLYRACRRQFRGALHTLARKVQPKYHWEDIVLPREQMEQLNEICGYIEYYHTVYGAWGFDRKLSTGKGLNVLFAGPSGTGKTMAAEIMANQLGLDLYKIDLSAIVSKYIGETEKNLDRIFREAQTSNAILFFDEADALFGKRSEVRDSHDRYANIEMA